MVSVRQPKIAKQILSSEVLNSLNTRSNVLGSIQLTGHLAIMGGSGYLWITAENWLLKIPALIINGFSLAAMFAVVRECCHRTAFANNHLNDIII